MGFPSSCEGFRKRSRIWDGSPSNETHPFPDQVAECEEAEDLWVGGAMWGLEMCGKEGLPAVLECL